MPLHFTRGVLKGSIQQRVKRLVVYHHLKILFFIKAILNDIN